MRRSSAFLFSRFSGSLGEIPHHRWAERFRRPSVDFQSRLSSRDTSRSLEFINKQLNRVNFVRRNFLYIARNDKHVQGLRYDNADYYPRFIYYKYIYIYIYIYTYMFFFHPAHPFHDKRDWWSFVSRKNPNDKPALIWDFGDDVRWWPSPRSIDWKKKKQKLTIK